MWRFAGASVTGTSHHATGASCQDAHLVRVVEGSDGTQMLVVAVSDGAGSAKHGATGSRIVTTSIVEQATAWLSSGGSVRAVDSARLQDWLDGVRENIAHEAGASGCQMRDYAATLLVALVDDTHSAFAQLGDGAIVTCDHHGEWGHEFWPDRGVFANQTYFVTDEEANSRLHFGQGLHPIKDLAVFTDGLERLLLDFTEHKAHAPAFEKMIQPLRAAEGDGPIEALSEALTRYLASPPVMSRTDDDVTLVIASGRR